MDFMKEAESEAMDHRSQLESLATDAKDAYEKHEDGGNGGDDNNNNNGGGGGLSSMF